MITATDGTITREFSCAAWSLMSDDTKAPWTVVENTCGRYNIFATPYASFEIASSVLGIIEGASPIVVTVEGGIATISILPRKKYASVIASNKVDLPTPTYTLPTNTDLIDVIVAGVEYEEGQQYTVDTGANRINFTRTNLNGMRCVVKFWP